MKITKKFITLFKGIDLSTRQLPVIIADSEVPGPTIGLTAAIHGDEVTGTAVILSLFKKFEDFPLIKGKIFALPILNPTGFETISRSEVYAGEDLNRGFNNDNHGSTAEILANSIINAILDFQPDYVIDLHTDSMNSIAYILVDKPSELKDKKIFYASLKLAEDLGFIKSQDTEETAGYPPEKCLTGQLIKKGIPAVTIELGGPLIVSEPFRKQGFTAIWNFLYENKLVSKRFKNRDNRKNKDLYQCYPHLTVNSTGIIDYRVQAGEHVLKGALLAKIRNVFGEVIEKIYSPETGIILSHEDKSVVFPGQSVFTLAVKIDN